MKYLVSCTCGHAMDRHGWEGCGGDGPGVRCRCRKDEAAALDAAIEHARRHPWDALAPNTLAERAGEGDAA